MCILHLPLAIKHNTINNHATSKGIASKSPHVQIEDALTYSSSLDHDVNASRWVTQRFCALHKWAGKVSTYGLSMICKLISSNCWRNLQPGVMFRDCARPDFHFNTFNPVGECSKSHGKMDCIFLCIIHQVTSSLQISRCCICAWDTRQDSCRKDHARRDFCQFWSHQCCDTCYGQLLSTLLDKLKSCLIAL